ncbi:MAG: hypothetical protein LC798_11880 [Chloroflexi bacterium]|nr:hypothetical protein [Chloroflexota bacterium]
MTGDERRSLLAWMAEHPSARVRYGRRQIASDVRRDGEVGYLIAQRGDTVAFRPRGSRYERAVRDLALLEIKVGSRYSSAATVLRRRDSGSSA